MLENGCWRPSTDGPRWVGLAALLAREVGGGVWAQGFAALIDRFPSKVVHLPTARLR